MSACKWSGRFHDISFSTKNKHTHLLLAYSTSTAHALLHSSPITTMWRARGTHERQMTRRGPPRSRACEWIISKDDHARSHPTPLPNELYLGVLLARKDDNSNHSSTRPTSRSIIYKTPKSSSNLCCSTDECGYCFSTAFLARSWPGRDPAGSGPTRQSPCSNSWSATSRWNMESRGFWFPLTQTGDKANVFQTLPLLLRQVLVFDSLVDDPESKLWI
jgi:hypothetical protein